MRKSKLMLNIRELILTLLYIIPGSTFVYISLVYSISTRNVGVIWIPLVLLIISLLFLLSFISFKKKLSNSVVASDVEKITVFTIRKPFFIWFSFALAGLFFSMLVYIKSTKHLFSIEMIYILFSVFSYVGFVGVVISGLVFIVKVGKVFPCKNSHHNDVRNTVYFHPISSSEVSGAVGTTNMLNFESNIISHDNNMAVNPANGLPMVNSTTDIHGNLYGFSSHGYSHIDINPASGLSMANSYIDVDGNVYGSSMSHDFVHHNHHHDIHSSHDIHSHYDHYNSHS
ncbi:hypothetical protein [Yersinia pseudotuberculosis]|uniref:hypothetical protein n=1 Tax=Yersinia pseudotuberculosis TaxID=633 RepID=UPI002B27C415|nr:hypothetical protein YPSE1_44590 [Yersinia pseudotuberculosis]